MPTKLTTTPSTYSTGLLSLLPLFYVGWADDELSDQEKKLIQKQINALPFLSREDRKILSEWSDPNSPPSEALIRHWADTIMSSTQNLNPKKKLSLVDLGLAMAKLSATETEQDIWREESTKSALDHIEKTIGHSDIDFFRSILDESVLNQQLALIDEEKNFDPAALQTILDSRAPEEYQKYRQLLASKAFATSYIRDKEAYRLKILEWCKELGKRGLGALSFPEAYGGRDNFWAYGALFNTMAQKDISLAIKYGVQFGLFGGSVYSLGTQYHHDKYLRSLAHLDLAGCFAMTETGHGSNVNGLEVSATYIPETKELEIHTPSYNAGKEYIGNALHSKMASVFCQLIVKGENHGVHTVLVPLRDEDHQLLPGISVEDNGYKLGLNGVDNGRIWFNKLRVPKANLLNRYGDIDENGHYHSPIANRNKRFFTMLGTLVGGRVFVPQAGVAAAKKGLAIAVKYALKRRQFPAKDGQKETIIMDYPTHQARLMPLLAKAYALHFALEYLTERFIHKSEEDAREIETMAAALKSYATWYTTETLQECREACGGKGYLVENQLADLKADTDIFTTFEGDNTVLMQLVAKGLLSEFKEDFHNNGFKAVMRVLMRQVSSTVFERNPITARNTDWEHLTSSEFHKSALEYRKHRLLISVSNRMRSMLKKKVDPYLAFLKCQTHLLSLANAYTEALIYEQFYLKIKTVEDAELKTVLRRLRNLYALTAIYDDRGWYLESNYFDGIKSKGIRKAIARLNRETRRDALGLVDAFGIPDELLGAPIVVES